MALRNLPGRYRPQKHQALYSLLLYAALLGPLIVPPLYLQSRCSTDRSKLAFKGTDKIYKNFYTLFVPQYFTFLYYKYNILFCQYLNSVLSNYYHIFKMSRQRLVFCNICHSPLFYFIISHGKHWFNTKNHPLFHHFSPAFLTII